MNNSYAYQTSSGVPWPKYLRPNQSKLTSLTSKKFLSWFLNCIKILQIFILKLWKNSRIFTKFVEKNLNNELVMKFVEENFQENFNYKSKRII